MGSPFHQLCPRYSGTLTPTAPTAIRLWDTFIFTFYSVKVKNRNWCLGRDMDHLVNSASELCQSGVSETGFNVSLTPRSYGDGTSVYSLI